MIEHESHFIAAAINASDTSAECLGQVIYVSEQNIGQDGAFEMAPQPFDEIQARTIRRQPVNLDLLAVRRQPFVHRLGMMKTPVVTYQADFSPGIDFHEKHKEFQKVYTALGGGDGVSNLAGDVVHTAVGHPLFIFSRCRYLRLAAHLGPGASQHGVPMNFHLILKDQGFRGVLPQRFFFRPSNSFWAL